MAIQVLAAGGATSLLVIATIRRLYVNGGTDVRLVEEASIALSQRQAAWYL